MKFHEAVRILMESAARDVRGSGLGFRSTTEAWREKVSMAWVVCFRRVYRREPSENEIGNAGMTFYRGDTSKENKGENKRGQSA